MATTSLHDDVYNVDKEGEVNKFKRSLKQIEQGKLEEHQLGLGLSGRVWGIHVPHSSLGLLDKNFKAIFSKLRDNHGRTLSKGQDLERIIHDFYKDIILVGSISKNH